MVSLQIELPDEIISKIKALSVRTEDFVIASVRKYLLEHEMKEDRVLMDGYKQSRLENQQILHDFKHVDLENWDEY
jgi:hypothetical protein